VAGLVPGYRPLRCIGFRSPAHPKIHPKCPPSPNPSNPPWKLDGGDFTATITTPPNTTADVILPIAGPIHEDGSPLDGKPGVLAVAGNRLTLGSGTYRLHGKSS
jgi:hypothetical protein